MRNHQFFTVVLYTDQDTFYKISSCSGNVKEEAGKSRESQGSQGRAKEESGKPGKCSETECGLRPYS